jgi:hypothetical protein
VSARQPACLLVIRVLLPVDKIPGPAHEQRAARQPRAGLVLGLRRFLIAVDKSPQLLVPHAIELAGAARRDLFDVEAPKLAAQALRLDGGAQLTSFTSLVTQLAQLLHVQFNGERSICRKLACNF